MFRLEQISKQRGELYCKLILSFNKNTLQKNRNTRLYFDQKMREEVGHSLQLL